MQATHFSAFTTLVAVDTVKEHPSGDAAPVTVDFASLLAGEEQDVPVLPEGFQSITTEARGWSGAKRTVAMPTWPETPTAPVIGVDQTTEDMLPALPMVGSESSSQPNAPVPIIAPTAAPERPRQIGPSTVVEPTIDAQNDRVAPVSLTSNAPRPLTVTAGNEAISLVRAPVAPSTKVEPRIPTKSEQTSPIWTQSRPALPQTATPINPASDYLQVIVAVPAHVPAQPTDRLPQPAIPVPVTEKADRSSPNSLTSGFFSPASNEISLPLRARPTEWSAVPLPSPGITTDPNRALMPSVHTNRGPVPENLIATAQSLPAQTKTFPIPAAPQGLGAPPDNSATRSVPAEMPKLHLGPPADLRPRPIEKSIANTPKLIDPIQPPFNEISLPLRARPTEWSPVPLPSPGITTDPNRALMPSVHTNRGPVPANPIATAQSLPAQTKTSPIFAAPQGLGAPPDNRATKSVPAEIPKLHLGTPVDQRPRPIEKSIANKPTLTDQVQAPLDQARRDLAPISGGATAQVIPNVVQYAIPQAAIAPVSVSMMLQTTTVSPASPPVSLTFETGLIPTLAAPLPLPPTVQKTAGTGLGLPTNPVATIGQPAQGEDIFVPATHHNTPAAIQVTNAPTMTSPWNKQPEPVETSPIQAKPAREKMPPASQQHATTTPPADPNTGDNPAMTPASPLFSDLALSDPIPREGLESIIELTTETARMDPLRDAPRVFADPKIPRQIAGQLVAAVRQGLDGPVEVTLNPEELGRVRMTLNASDGTMAVSLTIERPETADLMRRHLAALGAEFRDLGYSNVTFSFSGSGAEQRGSQQEQAAQTSTPTDRTTPDDPDITAAPSPKIATTATLDLRI